MQQQQCALEEQRQQYELHMRELHAELKHQQVPDAQREELDGEIRRLKNLYQQGGDKKGGKEQLANARLEERNFRRIKVFSNKEKSGGSGKCTSCHR